MSVEIRMVIRSTKSVFLVALLCISFPVALLLSWNETRPKDPGAPQRRDVPWGHGKNLFEFSKKQAEGTRKGTGSSGLTLRGFQRYKAIRGLR